MDGTSYVLHKPSAAMPTDLVVRTTTEGFSWPREPGSDCVCRRDRVYRGVAYFDVANAVQTNKPYSNLMYCTVLYIVFRIKLKI